MAYFSPLKDNISNAAPIPVVMTICFSSGDTPKDAKLPQTDLLFSSFSSKTGKSEYVASTFD